MPYRSPKVGPISVPLKDLMLRRTLSNVLPPSVDVARYASRFAFVSGSLRPSRNRTLTRSPGPTATLGRNCAVPSAPLSLTLWAGVHVLPPSDELRSQTSSSPSRPSAQVAYIFPAGEVASCGISGRNG